MADSIVLELQRLAANSDVPLTTVLRLALVVATKLKIQKFRELIENELNGYVGIEVPAYRVVEGDPKIASPDFTSMMYIPMDLLYHSDEDRSRDSVVSVSKSVSELEDILGESEPYILLDHPTLQRPAIETPNAVINRYFLAINQKSLRNILNKVRNLILQWSLKLEEQGILGNGMSFSKIENDAATNPVLHNTIINTGIYIAGDMTGGTASGRDHIIR